MNTPVRVLVVDDSALMRKLIPQILAADSSIQVVGTAMDGNFGLKKIQDLQPHVITLDLEMPGMGGLDMLKEIMRRHRLPVIVVSSHSTEGASVTLKALSMGAFDFVAKPSDVSARMPEIARELIAKIKAAANSPAVRVNSAYAPLMATPTEKATPDLRTSQPGLWPSGFLPAAPSRCNMSCRSCPRTFPEPSSSCNTCPKDSPRCFPGVWMRFAPSA
jgi:two-component system chemotaxis response regulator CheB